MRSDGGVESTIDLVVATSAFGLGIDVPNIRQWFTRASRRGSIVSIKKWGAAAATETLRRQCSSPLVKTTRSPATWHRRHT